MYDLHDLVCARVNDIDGIARAIRDINENSRARRRLRSSPCACTTHPFRDHLPVGVILRVELPATGMERISSRFGRERMHEHAAGESITRFDLIENTLEVQMRLFIGP